MLRSWFRIRVSYSAFHCQIRLDQLFAPEIMPRLIFQFLQSPFDDRLRGNSRMIGARHPQGLKATHAMPANADILQRIVQCMSQVQGTGHIGRWNNDGEGLARGIDLGSKTAVQLPLGVDLAAGSLEFKSIRNLVA